MRIDLSGYIGIILVLVVAAVLLIYVRSLSRIEKDNIIIQERLSLAQQFFDEVNGQVDGIRKYRHDLKKHIRIVEEFLNKGKHLDQLEKYQELLSLMSDMQDDVEKTVRTRFSDKEAG